MTVHLAAKGILREIGQGSGARAWALSVCTSLLVLGTQPGLLRGLKSQTVSDYPLVVQAVRELKTDRVVSPEDPTVPLLARGITTQSVYLLFDADGWRNQEAIVLQSLEDSEYVVDRKAWFQDAVTPLILGRAGYTRVEDWPSYSLWKLTESSPPLPTRSGEPSTDE